MLLGDSALASLDALDLLGTAICTGTVKFRIRHKKCRQFRQLST
jgi:hypothetical protein